MKENKEKPASMETTVPIIQQPASTQDPDEVLDIKDLQETSPQHSTFMEALQYSKKKEQKLLLKRLNGYFGDNTSLTLNDLPLTSRVLDKLYGHFDKEMKTTGFIDFSKMDDALTDPIVKIGEKKIFLLFDYEVYEYLEDKYLSNKEKNKLEKVVPDLEQRKILFVKYLHTGNIEIDKTIHTLKQASMIKENAGFLKKVFGKLKNGFLKLMSIKPQIEQTYGEEVNFDMTKTKVIEKSFSKIKKKTERKPIKVQDPDFNNLRDKKPKVKTTDDREKTIKM